MRYAIERVDNRLAPFALANEHWSERIDVARAVEQLHGLFDRVKDAPDFVEGGFIVVRVVVLRVGRSVVVVLEAFAPRVTDDGAEPLVELLELPLRRTVDRRLLVLQPDDSRTDSFDRCGDLRDVVVQFAAADLDGARFLGR